MSSAADPGAVTGKDDNPTSAVTSMTAAAPAKLKSIHPFFIPKQKVDMVPPPAEFGPAVVSSAEGSQPDPASSAEDNTNPGSFAQVDGIDSHKANGRADSVNQLIELESTVIGLAHSPETATGSTSQASTTPTLDQSNTNIAIANPIQPIQLKQATLFGGTIDLTASDSDDPPPPKSKAKARARPGKAKPKPKSSNQVDSDIIIHPSPKTKPRTSTRKKPTPATKTIQPAASASSDDDAVVRTSPAAKVDKGKGKAKDLGMIEIPDSPPPKKVTPMRPLGELTKLGQERRKVQPSLEVRWPTKDEHGGGGGGGGGGSGVNTRATAGPSTLPLRQPRWMNTVDHSPDCVDSPPDHDFFVSFGRRLHSPSAEAGPSEFPRLVHHSITALSSLLPTFASHPLLDRLAAPLRAPESSPGLFIRPSQPNTHAQADHKDPFTTKYAPKKADEMLGTLSRRSAGELKAWFEELAICNAAGQSGRPASQTHAEGEADSSLSRRRRLQRQPQATSNRAWVKAPQATQACSIAQGGRRRP